jgi:hypothetical protein
MNTSFPWARSLALSVALLAGPAAHRLGADPAAAPVQSQFTSPEEAAKALALATQSGDRGAVDAIFGPGVRDLLSGDPKQDAIEFAAFAKSIKQFTHLVKQSDDLYTLNIGEQNWPMPIPIVRKGGSWSFDTNAGKDEILSRRIGEDETVAIGVCRSYVEAQREYAASDHDGSGVLKYARRIKSTEGAKDGLYWRASPTEEQSPFGPLVAEAREEGYGGKSVGGPVQPFHGYLFKVLTAQGASAPGGAFDYVINGNLIAGFALVAYPAHWGESGVMTFIVNQWGKVYQCNLGEESAQIASSMTLFDPETGWEPVP